MSPNGSFQAQLSSIMEMLTTSAVAEITKLVDYSSALLFSEISRQQGENDALRKALYCMQIELGTERPKRGTSSVDISLEVQLCDEIRKLSVTMFSCSDCSLLCVIMHVESHYK